MAVNLVNIVTLNRVRLYEGQPGTSAAAVYTVPASTDAAIKTILLCNTTTTAATVTLWLQPSGAATAAANMIVNAQQVGANTTVVIDFPQGVMMTATDVLSASQGTSSAVTVVVSGETYA